VEVEMWLRFSYRAACILCYALLLDACSASNEDKVIQFIVAHNEHNIDTALALLADDVEVSFSVPLGCERIVTLGGSGSGLEAVRDVEEFRYAVNSHLVAEEIETKGDTVNCQLRETSDFFRLLGIDTVQYASADFVFRNGLIREIRASHGQQSCDEINERTRTIQHWIAEESDLVSALTPDDRWTYTAENAGVWLRALNDWARYEAPFVSEVVEYQKGPVRRLANNSGLVVAKKTGETVAIFPELDEFIDIGDRRVCLDKRGSVIKRQGMPALVQPFRARQRAEIQRAFDPFGSVRLQVTKIYPCENCASVTGVEGCAFVW
jgi:hypothetical protein